MIRAILAATFALAAVAGAQAAPDRDRSIDRAAAEIVAGKLGELRGGFGHGEQPDMTPRVDSLPTGSLPEGWIDGLAPAAEIDARLPDIL